MKVIEETKESKKIETINFVGREERQGDMPKMSKEEEKENKEFNDLKTKIIMEHCDEIFKLLARKGYYEYSKDEKDGKPVYTPTEMLLIKIMAGVLSIHKKDGYLNEIYVDNNERELDEEGFHAVILTVFRCFPDVIFPDEWFGTYDKEKLFVQAFVVTSLLGATFGLKEIVKGFFKNSFYKDMGILLDWYIGVEKVSRSRAFSIVAGEIGKSTSYVRDHCNDGFG